LVLTQTSVRVILITEQMFGVLIMMLMNPSSYRSIHTQRSEAGVTGALRRRRLAFIGRHALKLLAAAALFLLVFTGLSLAGTSASGDITRPAEGETVFTVGSGDTLWSIANHHFDNQDTGFVVFAIKERNRLSNSTIFPGQVLIIPKLN
jgi:Uncharacterized protein containing LysM domain